MALIDELADNLARDAMAVAKESGNDEFPEELGKDIGRLSTTLEETYLTAIRFLRAEEMARDIMAKRFPEAVEKLNAEKEAQAAKVVPTAAMAVPVRQASGLLDDAKSGATQKKPARRKRAVPKLPKGQ